MQHSASGVCQWDALGTKPNEPSVNIVLLNPKNRLVARKLEAKRENRLRDPSLQKSNSNGGNDNARAC